MIRTLMAAAALALCAPGLALAQTAANAGATAGVQMTAQDALASKLIGSPIYSTLAANNNGSKGNSAASSAATADGTSPNGVAAPSGASAMGASGAVANTASDTNAQQIGTISDLVVDRQGTIKAVVVGIGGVLGIGQKSVAVPFTQVKWQVAADGSVRGALDTTADALKAAPDFKAPTNGQATTVGDNRSNASRTAGSGTAPGATTTPGTAPAPGAAPTTSGTMTTPGMAATTPGATTGPGSANASTNNAATTFATTAGPANLFEIQSSQLALKQTQTAGVTAFAQRMITDHTKAGQDMQAALKSDNISVPAPALTQDQQQQMSQLQGLKGQQFDQAYIQAQVKAHDDAVNLFQNYSQSGPVGALKTFAGKTLPVLKMHQQMIHKLAGK